MLQPSVSGDGEFLRHLGCEQELKEKKDRLLLYMYLWTGQQRNNQTLITDSTNSFDILLINTVVQSKSGCRLSILHATTFENRSLDIITVCLMKIQIGVYYRRVKSQLGSDVIRNCVHVLESNHFNSACNYVKLKVSFSAKAVSKCCSKGLKCDPYTVGVYTSPCEIKACHARNPVCRADSASCNMHKCRSICI